MDRRYSVKKKAEIKGAPIKRSVFVLSSVKPGVEMYRYVYYSKGNVYRMRDTPIPRNKKIMPA